MELALIIAGVVAVVALHYFLVRPRAAWLGAVVPLLWVVGLVWLFTRGEIDRPLDYVMCALSAVLLIRIYSDGRKTRRA